MTTYENHSFYLALFDNNLLASQRMSYEAIDIFNLTSGEIKFSLKGHTDAVFEMRQLDIANLMASKSLDQTIKIWNLTSGEMKYSFDEENNYSDLISTFKSLCSFSDGKRELLASGSMSNIHVWNLSTGKLEFSLQTETTNVLALAKLEKQYLASAYGFVN